MAELIREAALEGVRDELPHSLAVVIDEVNPRPDRDDLVDVHAVLYVERELIDHLRRGRIGIKHLTVYAFSHENWKRDGDPAS